MKKIDNIIFSFSSIAVFIIVILALLKGINGKVYTSGIGYFCLIVGFYGKKLIHKKEKK